VSVEPVDFSDFCCLPHIFPTANHKLPDQLTSFARVETMKKKRQMIAVDDLDKGILQALQENARQTYKEIGNHLGVAHSTAFDRIKRLEKQGVIKKYTAIVDLTRIGRKNITAIMTIFTNPKESENVAERLSESEEVLEVSTSLSEELLIIAKVVAEDQDKLHSFIAQKVAPLPGVLRIRTSIITRKYKDEMFILK
jgi:DNA-binding Lrp family transcriptional regulator